MGQRVTEAHLKAPINPPRRRDTQKSWIQTQTSFNTISFFEGFTTASYIRDERLHTPDRGKKKKEKRSNRRRSYEAHPLSTAIFTTLLRNTLLYAVLLSTPSVVCRSSGSNFLVVSCLSCGITSETRLQIPSRCSSAFSFS